MSQELTPEQMRVMIAQACGWTPQRLVCSDVHCVQEYCDGNHGLSSAPDFCADLNAMAQAEETLNPDVSYHYGEELARIVFAADIQVEKDCGLRENEDDSLFPPNGYGWFAIAHATALQRSTAFCRVLQTRKGE